MKVMEFITSFFAWVQIVASPTVAGCVVGIFVYKNYDSTAGLIISIVIALAGLITGILFATKIWKTRGTVEFIAGEPVSQQALEEEQPVSHKKETPHHAVKRSI